MSRVLCALVKLLAVVAILSAVWLALTVLVFSLSDAGLMVYCGVMAVAALGLSFWRCYESCDG